MAASQYLFCTFFFSISWNVYEFTFTLKMSTLLGIISCIGKHDFYWEDSILSIKHYLCRTIASGRINAVYWKHLQLLSILDHNLVFLIQKKCQIILDKLISIFCWTFLSGVTAIFPNFFSPNSASSDWNDSICHSIIYEK